MKIRRRFICCIFLAISMMFVLEGCNFPFLSDLYPVEKGVSIRGEAASSYEEDTGRVSGAEEGDSLIYVHVCGCVRHPGLYSFKEGDRIDAAIRAAGGFTSEADQKSVNLARTLEDGSQIRVLSDGGGSEGTSGSGDDPRIDLNQADKNQLMTLSGIGESRALAIIAYRDAHGSFSSVEELKKVDGIGEGIYQKIKDLIKV